MRTTWRRLPAIVVTAWALAVAGLAVYAVQHGRATAPEQSPIRRALPQADLATGYMIDALDRAGAVVTVEAYRNTECRITAARAGVRYRRTLTAYTAEGGEPDLLTGLARAMPGRYSARLTRKSTGPVFTAMDRSLVGLRGEVVGAGQVDILVDTGCRTGSTTVDEPAAGQVPEPVTASARAAFEALGLGPGRWTAAEARCPDGGRLLTVAASAPSAAGLPSGAAMLAGTPGGAAGGAVLLDRGEVVVYRTGGTAVVVRRTGGTVTVAATAGCASP